MEQRVRMDHCQANELSAFVRQLHAAGAASAKTPIRNTRYDRDCLCQAMEDKKLETRSAPQSPRRERRFGGLDQHSSDAHPQIHWLSPENPESPLTNFGWLCSVYRPNFLQVVRRVEATRGDLFFEFLDFEKLGCKGIFLSHVFPLRSSFCKVFF